MLPFAGLLYWLLAIMLHISYVSSVSQAYSSAHVLRCAEYYYYDYDYNYDYY